MPEDDDINMKRHLRGIVDKASWLTVDASTPEPDVIHCLSKLNSRSKNVCLTYQRKLNQFDELLQTIVQLRRQTGTAEVVLLFRDYADSSGNQVGLPRLAAAVLVLRPSSGAADRISVVSRPLGSHRLHGGDDGALPTDEATTLSL